MRTFLPRAFRLLPAWLAVVSLCFWPAFTLADCCCERGDGAECCQSDQAEGESACCSAEVESACCQNGGAKVAAETDPKLDDCSCALRCCELVVIQATPSTVANPSDDSDDAGIGAAVPHLVAAPASHFAAADWRASLPVDDASARCSLLCRWLK